MSQPLKNFVIYFPCKLLCLTRRNLWWFSLWRRPAVTARRKYVYYNKFSGGDVSQMGIVAGRVVGPQRIFAGGKKYVYGSSVRGH